MNATQKMANAIRVLAMDAVEKANSGHPGMPMGMADVATVLFADHMKLDPNNPDWPDRDRFVLSAGHGSMLLYALYHLVGYDDMPMAEIENFRQLGARTAGHPEYGHAAGIETTTGPLGQGIATAVGMALGERLLANRFGEDLVDHFTYAICGDGCLQEGISHEAIDFAGTMGLARLILFWDDNEISIDGPVSLSSTMNQQVRFEAAGWHVQSIDGHDLQQISKAIAAAKASDRPSMIACKTKIGCGAPNLEGSAKTHGAPLGAEEISNTRRNLSWDEAPFDVPQDVYDGWKIVAENGNAARMGWQNRLVSNDRAAEFLKAVEGNLGREVFDALKNFIDDMVSEAPKVATRKASEMALEVINNAQELTIGGSADLTGSNLTWTPAQKKITPADIDGRYIHFGIREHAMGAIMNGLALHGGFVPYGGTFLVFSDYARGAIRLSALMKLRVIYVLTHDSIGLGEDGPTHQPVEHLAMLRATPNLNVYRPADVVETAECWEMALRTKDTPSAMILSRQGLPTVRHDHAENRCARGAYILEEADGERHVTLMATGSEVEIALAASVLLKMEGIEAAIVSMPCFELFEQQDATYQHSVLGDAPRIGIEAQVRQGWDRWIAGNGGFIGMDGFGASAPAPQLYKHFNITPQAVAEMARSFVQNGK
ncbi:transketolase [Ahrensia sp. AH-315-G08]|nr:transketolase [Ahrensia sp. AH-315-G08]